MHRCHIGPPASVRLPIALLSFLALLYLGACRTATSGELVTQSLATAGENAVDSFNGRFPASDPELNPLGVATFDSFDTPFITGSGQVMFFAELLLEPQPNPNNPNVFLPQPLPRGSIWTTNVIDQQIPLVAAPQAYVKFRDPAPILEWDFPLRAPDPFFDESIKEIGIFDSGAVIFRSGRTGQLNNGANPPQFLDPPQYFGQTDRNFIWQSMRSGGPPPNEDAVFGNFQPDAVQIKAVAPTGHAAYFVKDSNGVEKLFGGNTKILRDQDVPGVPAGSSFVNGFATFVRDYAFRANGDMAFRSQVNIPAVNPNPAKRISGIYLASNGLTKMIAEDDVFSFTGNGPPTTDAKLTRIDRFLPMDLTDLGEVGFFGEYTVDNRPSAGVFLGGAGGSFQQIVQTGQQINATVDNETKPVILGEVRDMLVKPDGTVYFAAIAEIRQFGQLGIFRNHIWEVANCDNADPNDPIPCDPKPQSIVYEGGLLLDGELLPLGDKFSLKDVNPAGELVFTNQLDRSDPFVNSTNDDALFVYRSDPLGPPGFDLTLVAREGDPVDRLGDPERVFGALEVRRGWAISDNGHIAFRSGISDILLSRIEGDAVVDYVWTGDGQNNNWHTIPNWADARMLDPVSQAPGEEVAMGTETATIADANVAILDRKVRLKSLTSTGGTLEIKKPLRLDDDSRIEDIDISDDIAIGSTLSVKTGLWQGGDIGATRPDLVASRVSQLRIEKDGGFVVSHDIGVNLNTNLVNHGTFGHDSGILAITENAKFTNFFDGTYTIKDEELEMKFGAVFENWGMFRKDIPDADSLTGGAGVTGTFHNFGGTVKLGASATLEFVDAGTHWGALFDLDNNSEVLLYGTNVVTPEGTVANTDLHFQSTGAGKIVINRGEFGISPGAIAEMNRVEIELGVLDIQGVLRTKEYAEFRSGQIAMGPQGKIENRGTFVFEKKDIGLPLGTPFLMGGTFVNMKKTDADRPEVELRNSELLLAPNTLIENQLDTTFKMTDSTIKPQGVLPRTEMPRFVNQGHLVVRGAGRSELDIPLEDQGVIRVEQGGTFYINRPSSYDSTSFRLVNDSTVRFSGDQTFQGIVTFDGGGSISFDPQADNLWILSEGGRTVLDLEMENSFNPDSASLTIDARSGQFANIGLLTLAKDTKLFGGETENAGTGFFNRDTGKLSLGSKILNGVIRNKGEIKHFRAAATRQTQLGDSSAIINEGTYILETDLESNSAMSFFEQKAGSLELKKNPLGFNVPLRFTGGEIKVESGSVSFTRGSESKGVGTFRIGKNASITADGGVLHDFTLDGTYTIAGQGEMRMASDFDLKGTLENHATVVQENGYKVKMEDQAQIVNRGTYKFEGSIEFNDSLSGKPFKNVEGASLRVVKTPMSAKPGNLTIGLIDNEGTVEVVGTKSLLHILAAEQLEEVSILDTAILSAGEWIVDAGQIRFGDENEFIRIREIGKDASIKIMNGGIMDFVNPLGSDDFVNNGRFEIAFTKDPTDSISSHTDIENNGIFRLSASNLVLNNSDFVNNELLVIDANSSLNVFGDAVFEATGTSFNVIRGEVTGTRFQQEEGSTFTGAGKIHGARFDSAGNLLPANSPGVLTLDVQEFHQAATGNLEIELGGPIAADEYDQLVITGEATLNGTLEVQFLNRYIPSTGDRFTILTAGGGVNGSFANTSDDQLKLIRGSFDVDYNPTSVELFNFQLNGDFNQNGVLDAGDIDLLTAEVAANTHDARFDLDGDEFVNQTDRRIWVDEIALTYFGDANLDGEFNSGDFIFVFQAGEYEDAIAGNSTWGTGDWNGDGDFSTTDFIVAFQTGSYEIGPRVNTQVVPEPASLRFFFLGGLFSLFGLRRIW